MVRVRSPLRIPEERGVAFRVVLSTLVSALSVSIAAMTARGIQCGKIMWPSRYQPHVYVDQLTRPDTFWVAVVLYIVLCAWLLYASVGEILYTTRKHKRR